MKNVMESGLSLEEIYLICQCTAKEKDEILDELNEYLDNLGGENEEMFRLVVKTIDKVKLLSPGDIEKIKEYQMEEAEK